MAPFGSLLAGTMAHWFGAPLTVILNGATVILGAAWSPLACPPCAQPSHPIYREMGILPVEVVSGMTAGGAS